MVSVSAKQGQTFNRTGRQHIPSDCLSFHLDSEGQCLEIRKLSPEPWLTHLATEDKKHAVVHFDIDCRMYNERISVGSVLDVASSEWNGKDVPLFAGLLDGFHSAFITVTVSLDSDDKRHGLILAKSDKSKFFSGQSNVGGALGVVPDEQVTAELWKLDLDNPAGPTVLLNWSLREGWTDFRELPLFKYGILPYVLRDLYLDIAIHQQEPKDWAPTWLNFPGASGLKEEMPPIEDESTIEDITQFRDWADRTAEAVSAALNIYDKYRNESDPEDDRQ